MATASRAAFQLSTAFEQPLPGPALPGLVALGRFLPAPPPNGDDGDHKDDGLAVDSSDGRLRTTTALSLAVCSSGQRVFLHNNNRRAATTSCGGRLGAVEEAMAVPEEEEEDEGGEGRADDSSVHDDGTRRKKSTKQPAGGGGSRSTTSSARGHPHTTLGGTEGGWEFGGTNQIVTLRFGREATAIAAGSGFGVPSQENVGEAHILHPQHQRCVTGQDAPPHDALLLGSSQSLLAYDIPSNTEFYYKEVEDGVHTMVHGLLRPSESAATRERAVPLTVIGGSGAVLGIDRAGEECLWAVTGDPVRSLAVLPWHSDRGASSSSSSSPFSLHLIAGAEDNVMRVFHGADLQSSIAEADTVRQIVPQYNPLLAAPHPHSQRFAYMLENGTVGMYDGSERLWRIKGKSKPVAAAFCDVDGDGEEELVVGWDNGRVEVRGAGGAGSHHGGGELLFRHQYAHPISSVLTADYRGGGTSASPLDPLPLLTTTDGVVRGLQLHSMQQPHINAARQLAALQEKVASKKELVAQLESLEHQLAVAASGEVDTTLPSLHTSLHVATVPNPNTQKLDIQFYLTGADADTVISSAVLRCDPALGGVDSNGCAADPQHTRGEDAWCFVAGDTPSSSLLCPVTYDRIQSTRLHASLCVGGVNAANAHVYELFLELPAFIMYTHLDLALRQYPGLFPPQTRVDERDTEGKPMLSLFFNEDLNCDDFPAVLRQLFSIPNAVPLQSAAHDESGNDMTAYYRIPIIHLLSLEKITIEIRQPASPSAWRTVSFFGASMVMCGDILQELSAALPRGFTEGGGADPVHVRYRFDKEGEALRRVLQVVQERSEARTTLSVGMADNVAGLRLTLIQAEDARLLGEMASMKRSYASVMEYNDELMADNRKRRHNFEELKGALREVNLSIQRAARLRLGAAAKGAFVTACRNALRDHNVMQLLDLITTGVQ